MATNIPQDDFQKTALRLPKELHAALHEAAASNGRSYNAEIVARLQASLDDHIDANTQAAMLAEIYFLLDKQREELLALHHQSIAELTEAARAGKSGGRVPPSLLPPAGRPSVDAAVKRLGANLAGPGVLPGDVRDRVRGTRTPAPPLNKRKNRS